jgi:8-oxo-dGTP pyrophosphatase MutT (NUDIX family)
VSGMLAMDELVAVTRARLAGRQRRVVVGGPLVKAAVLLPLVDRGEPFVVFAKRTDRVGTHRGQISFPGGRVDASDAGFLEAALRESEEEIGLPRTAVEALGALDDTETVATQFIITPFVGVVRAPVAWQPDGHEIEKVIEVPLAALRDLANLRVEYRERGGVRHEILFWDYQGETIWGATARILKQYLDVLGDV